METGGMLPDGIELKSQYYNLNGTGGFEILESTDPAALADYAIDWNGLVKMKITASMTMTQLAAFLMKNLVNGGPIN